MGAAECNLGSSPEVNVPPTRSGGMRRDCRTPVPRDPGPGNEDLRLECVDNTDLPVRLATPSGTVALPGSFVPATPDTATPGSVPGLPGGLASFNATGTSPGFSLVVEDDKKVVLTPSGSTPSGAVRRYRMWSYNGFDRPLAVSPPFLPWPTGGKVDLTGRPGGIFVFQVADVRTLDDVVLGRSATQNVLVGLLARSAGSTPMPTRPLVWETDILATQLPTLVGGVPRPSQPVIRAAQQSKDGSGKLEIGRIFVVLGATPSEQIQYRYWPHSGHEPPDGARRWLPAGSLSDPYFRFSGVVANELAGSVGLYSVWDVQVRVSRTAVVNGVSTVIWSEPSDPFVVQLQGVPP